MRIQSLPVVVIEVAGQELQLPANRILSNIRIQQRLSLPALCEVTFKQSVPDPRMTAGMFPGDSLKVYLRENPPILFSGEITAVEYSYGANSETEIRVRGYDLMHRLRKQQSLRAHVQVTFGDIAQTLAAEAGLQIEDVSKDTLLWEYVIQHQQSNLDLLLDLGSRRGLYLTVSGETLQVIDLDGLNETIQLEANGNLIEGQIEINAEQACTSVTTLAWDTQYVATYEDRVGLAADHFPSVTRTEESLDQFAAANQIDRTLVDESASGAAHARGLAEAELARRNAQKVTLRGIASGDPRLRPGVTVELVGVTSDVSEGSLLTSVTHTIDAASGFISEFSTVLPVPPERPQTTIATPGHVTRINDPELLGRVRVYLPTYGGIETNWMPVVTLGAGSGKGLVALPQPGDTVLVLLMHGDPGQGVVLGGLYGVEKLPVDQIDPSLHTQFTFVTRAGQRIRIDDEHNTIQLETRDGSSIKLTPDEVRVHAAADLVLEAPGKTIVLRGENIDFQKG